MLIGGYPIHFSYEGDESEVMKWLPQGKRLIQLCIDGNLPARRQTIGPDVEIRAGWINGIGSLHIKAGSISAINGLLDFLLPPYPALGGIEPRWSLVDADGKPYQAIKNFSERKESPAGPSFSEFTDNRFLAKSITPNTISTSPLQYNPGMFSGEMRKVVQVLYGLGRKNYYTPLFYATHGIYYGGQKRWVIEISLLRGVLAWQLPIDHSSTHSGTSAGRIKDILGYIPKENKLVSTGHARILATSVEISEFYNNSFPLFNECGWAFNSTGSEAVNTRFIYLDTGYLFGALFKINIESESGAPVKATISKQREDFVFGDRVSHVKVPSYSNSSIISFDWYSHLGPPSNTAPWAGPVYAYYDASDSMVLVDSYFSASTTPPTYLNDWVDPISTGSPDYIGTYYLNVLHSSGQQYAPRVTGGSFSAEIAFNDSYVGGSTHITTRVENKSGVWWGLGIKAAEGELQRDNTDVFYFDVRAIIGSLVVVIPMFDREALIIQKGTTEVSPSGYNQILGTSFWWGLASIVRTIAGDPSSGTGSCTDLKYCPSEETPPGTWGPAGGEKYITGSLPPISTPPNYISRCFDDYIILPNTLGSMTTSPTAWNIVNKTIMVTTKSRSASSPNPEAIDLSSFWTGEDANMIECVSDPFSGDFFCNFMPNALSGTDLTIQVANYPVSTMPNNFLTRTFIGVP